MLSTSLDFESMSELCTSRRLSSSVDTRLPSKMEHYECLLTTEEIEAAIDLGKAEAEFSESIQALTG